MLGSAASLRPRDSKRMKLYKSQRIKQDGKQRKTDYWVALGPIEASGVKVRNRGFDTSTLSVIS